MKKMFFALAALVLAFTGCSQEEDAIQVSEKKAVKVVVNMDKPGFGEDTRAARQGWVANDRVAVMLNGDLEHLIVLTYNGTSWEEIVLSFTYDGEDYLWTYTGAAATDSYLASLPSSGDLKAIYCSSVIQYFLPIPGTATAADQLTGIDIYSLAREAGMGECIMTCDNDDNDDNDDNGTYSASGGVLTLNIIMKPQVAQFTIKDLSDGEDDNEGKTSEGLEVGVAGLVAYSGGTITPSGIELNQVNDAGYYNGCWVHPNNDGISIYAAVDSSYEPDTYSDFIYFSVDDGNDYYYVREFGPYDTYKAKVTKGAAIIMDGPTDATIDAGKWYPPA